MVSKAIATLQVIHAGGACHTRVAPFRRSRRCTTTNAITLRAREAYRQYL